MTFRYAICNETFADWDHARVCDVAASYGYSGLEIAPFTLAPLITEVTSARRSEIRRQAESAGLRIIALHWLLAKTEGFSLTASDVDTRSRTANYLAELAQCCRDLGGDILVFGSPQQRRIPLGATREIARANAVDTIQRVLRALDDTGVYLCLEPLAANETDFLNTCEEAESLLDQIAHPRVQLHLDVKAMTSEAVAVPELIRHFGSRARHFHANDPNRRGPGFGDTDFRPIFAALNEVSYSGWVSVEVFDYSPDPDTIARESIRYMKSCE